MKRWINLKKVWPIERFPDPNKTSKKEVLIHDFSKSDTIGGRCGPAIGSMESILEAAGLKLEGNHHSGIDDTKNLSRCVIFLLEKEFQFTQGMVNSHPFYKEY